MTEFNYNENRDAWGAIRGFVYQVELTIEKWISLEDDEILELEKGEDIDVVRNHIENIEERELGQVKYREGSLTINSISFIEAFANFIVHIKNNPKHKLSLHYITNAEIACEKSAIFIRDKKYIPALEIWQKNQVTQGECDKNELQELLKVVRANISKLKLTKDEILICLQKIEQDSIFFDLVKRTIISSGKPSINTLSKSIKNQMKNIHIKNTDTVYYILFTYIFKILSKKGRKFLDKSQLLELINNQSRHQDEYFLSLKSKLITMEKKLDNYHEESQNGHKITHDKIEDLKKEIQATNKNDKNDKNKKNFNFLTLSNLLLSEENFDANKKSFLDEIVKNLKKDFNSLDFIIITGNFVEKQSLCDISELYMRVADVFSKIGVEENQVIICPGVNEFRSDKVSPIILNAVENFEDNDEIESFVLSEDFDYSCRPIERYNQFSEQAYNGKDLYSAHFINGNSIGIISINSFWTHSNDLNKVVFPLSVLEKAYNEIKNAESKILISNKPFSCFKRFNKSEVEIFALEKFDVLIVDNITSEQHFISEEGILEVEIGKSTGEDLKLLLCKYNIDKKTIIRTDCNYSIKEQNFTIGKDIPHTIPSEQQKKNQIKVIKKLQSKYNRYLEIGNELSVNKQSNKSFLKKFTNPLLKDYPKEKEHHAKKIGENYYDEILSSNKNYLIFGKDKTGKSSLLIRLAIENIINFKVTNIIPIYINLDEYEYYIDTFDIFSIIRKQMTLSINETKRLKRDYKFRLLLDNFNPAIDQLNQNVLSFLSENDNFSYVVCTDETIVRSFDEFDYGFQNIQRLFIRELERPQIKSLITNSIQEPEDYDINELSDRIIKLFKQHNIPFNFWATSIFIWIIVRTNRNNSKIQNNSELIEIFIEDVIGKRSIANLTIGLTYEQYLEYLAFLAYNLYKFHSDNIYSIDYKKLVIITDEFLGKTRRRNAATEDVIKFIIDRDLLKKTRNGYYTFRLNGVFEYFLARNLIYDKEFLNNILASESGYLSFKNELDLYSGFRDRNKDDDDKFISRIYKKVKLAFNDLNTKYSGNIDKTFSSKVYEDGFLGLLFGNDKLSSTIQNSVSSLEKHEEFLDMALPVSSGLDQEVKVKREFDEEAEFQESLETHLFILGRVFRNIELKVGVNSEKNQEDEILGFIIQSACHFGFSLMDDMDEIKDNESPLPIELMKVLKVISPVVIQDIVYNSIGHRTIDKIVLDRISLLEKTGGNVLELFVLYFLYVDTDIKNRLEYIDKAIDSVKKITVIRVSILIKLFMYVVTKTYHDKKTTNLLFERIQKVQHLMNPKASKASIEQKMQVLRKNIKSIEKKSKEDNDL